MVIEYITALAFHNVWRTHTPTITTTEFVFDEASFGDTKGKATTVPARSVDTVLQGLCEEEYHQFAPAPSNPQPWTAVVGLPWSGRFTPLRNYANTVQMWIHAFDVPAHTGAYVEAFKITEAGQQSYFRDDPDTMKRVRRTYVEDLEVDYRISRYPIETPPETGV